MSADRWKVVKDLFVRALDVPPEERLRFLERECRDDSKLLAEILELLAEAHKADAFLRAPADLPEATDAAAMVVGQRLDDFELLHEIGRGGMGRVHLARQVSLDRLVAVKVLLPHLAALPEQVTRFEREARNMARLRHPGIVPVHAVGAVGDLHYFAMEHVSGHDLAAEISALRGRAPSADFAANLPAFDSPDYVARVADIVAQAGEALHHAHESGVVHRDVKPKNLLIADDGRLMVVDFGLARDARLGEITNPGDVAGTPHYMSPEQAEVRRRRRIDHRTDVYSLGVVLYELLTLRRPFDGQTSIEVLAQIAQREPAPITRWNPRVPHDLQVVCSKAMEKEPHHRYSTAREFVEDLRRFLRHEAVLARPPSLRRRVTRSMRRHSRLVTAVLVLGVGLAAGGWFVKTHARDSRETELRAEMERLLAREVDASDALALRAFERFEVEVGPSNSATAAAHARLAARFEEERARRESTALDAVRSLSAAPRTALDTPGTDRATSSGEAMLAVARSVNFGGSTPALVADLVRLSAARLSIDVQGDAGSGDASFLVQRLDSCTGRPARAVRTQATRAADGRRVLDLPEGVFRVTVVVAGAGFAQLVRHLPETGREYRATAWIRFDSDARRGMTRVPGARYPLPVLVQRQTGPGNEELDVPHELEDFDLATTPVTNAEWEEFALATGARRPAFWPTPLPEGWKHRPVTDVDAHEARLYCEWRGARLPTLAERGLAFRGLERATFPPGITAEDPALGGLQVGRPTFKRYEATTEAGLERVREWYAENVLAVGTSHAVVGDFRDVLGNVSEWTESWLVDFARGEYRGSLGLRTRAGAGCNVSLDDVRKAGLAFQTHAPEDYPAPNNGFRCARCARPPPTD